MIDLSGNVAIVTGGARGIGKAIAQGLADLKATVVVADLSGEDAETVALHLVEQGRSAKGVAVDVANGASVADMVRTVIDQQGRLDILCSNAGIFPSARIDTMSESEWDRVQAVNLKGTFLCVQACLPHMRRQRRGRIVVTSFASNIHRVQQVIDAAVGLDRKIALVGRSMRKNFNIATNLGIAHAPEGMIIHPKEIEDYPDHKVIAISTGSQGEPLSALRRMAFNDHRDIELHSGDTVIFSATAIPGNERAVNETIDRIYEIGARVITPADAPIHVSGHGSREELKLMLNLTRPRYVMPFHGDHKRIRLHGELAEAVGVPPENIFRGRNGLPLVIDENGARWGEDTNAGMIFVDGVDIGDPNDVALRDRRTLSADGVLIVVATISSEDGESVAPPEVLFRGVPFIEGEAAASLVEEVRELVTDVVADAAEDGVRENALIQQDIHDAVAELIYERLRRRPMVLPVVVEV